MVNEAIVRTALDESSDEVITVVSVVAVVSVVVDSSFSAQEIMVRLKPETKIIFKSFLIFFLFRKLKKKD